MVVVHTRLTMVCSRGKHSAFTMPSLRMPNSCSIVVCVMM